MSGKSELSLWPREKALQLGVEALTTPELLALVLRTGTIGQPVVAFANNLLQRCNGLSGLAAMSYHELKQLPGIKDCRAHYLKAVFELARRLALERSQRAPVRALPENIYAYFAPLLEGCEQEQFIVGFLNVKCEIVGYRMLTKGSINASIVHPRDIFREAIRANAPRIVLVHNHPSGDPTPSEDDQKITQAVAEIGYFLGILLINHIIIGQGKFAMIKGTTQFDKE